MYLTQCLHFSCILYSIKRWKDFKMIRKNFKKIGMIGAVASSLLFTACTPQEQALASGVAMGAVAGVALSSYSYPHYYNQPYYYNGGRYYYGGYYRGGYYYYRGHRYRSGHYYNNGYRYYNGRRYRANVGSHGYYTSRNQYNNRSRYRNNSRNNYNRGNNRSSRTRTVNRRYR